MNVNNSNPVKSMNNSTIFFLAWVGSAFAAVGQTQKAAITIRADQVLHPVSHLHSTAAKMTIIDKQSLLPSQMWGGTIMVFGKHHL